MREAVPGGPTVRDKGRKFLLEPYLDWAEAQGVPIYEDFASTCARSRPSGGRGSGINGAICHLKGPRRLSSRSSRSRLPPGGSSAPVKHIYEEVIYVISGHGTTAVRRPRASGTFEWGPKSLFAIPLNADHRHFNASGREPARFASTNNLVLR